MRSSGHQSCKYTHLAHLRQGSLEVSGTKEQKSVNPDLKPG